MKLPFDDDAVFVIGPEVTTTAAEGLKTLYVVGFRSVVQMKHIIEEHKCKNVVLGANNSYQKNKLWNDVIQELLNTGVRVTFEYPIKVHEKMLEVIKPEIFAHPNFIPVVEVELENIENVSKNFTIRFNDNDDNKTNSGVWTVPHTEILDTNRHTLWQDFNNFEVLYREGDISNLKYTLDKMKKA